MIPSIDVSAILEGRLDSPAAQGVQQKLRDARAEVGFMTVTGHGIPRSLIAEVVSAAEGFFALPPQTKLAVAPRRWNPDNPNVYRGYFPSSVAGKEGLDVGDPALCDPALLARPYHERNRLPAELGASAIRAIETYFAAASQLSATLLRALVAALAGDPGRVDEGFGRPASLSTLRFNFYPERDQPVAWARDDGMGLSCEAHVDSGLLTLLHQDRRGGLEVRARDGGWHTVPPDAGAFVVNMGLALQRMTGRELVATRHRVRFERRMRLSIPFFFEPVPDFVMAPQSLGLPYHPSVEPLEYEAFLRESLAKFAEYQR